MQYPFLQKNELILFDYIPGSSGQLLMRLWSELDGSILCDEDEILTESPLAEHECTREIRYDIGLPKRIHNWYLDKCHPETVDDYAAYFEFVGTALVALRQRWHKSDRDEVRFYQDDQYVLSGCRVLHGIHTWDRQIPVDQLRARGLNVMLIKIQPATHRGSKYQIIRNMLCYPSAMLVSKKEAQTFNTIAAYQHVDLCTWLVDKNTKAIIDWLHDMIGDSFQTSKLSRAIEILDTYYECIIKPLKKSQHWYRQ